MKIEIIKNKKDWTKFLSLIDDYDCYHTYDYHQLSKASTDSAVLLKYEKDGVIIGLPLLIRKINDSKFYDAISVYGYSGPITKGISATYNFKGFRSSLNQFFLDENIISVFIRLNPYIPHQNAVFHGFGELTYLGKIVNINLGLTLDEQRHKYHRRLKSQVNKSYRECTIKLAKTTDDFNQFKTLYHENMKRVGAKQFYFFDDGYFDKIRNANDFETSTFLAIDNNTGKTIAGCMFIKVNNIIQYHLSGAAEDYLYLNAKKLLIDNMRTIGTDEGFKYFNLGGGLGANEHDSLFRFKSSFSNDYNLFFIWKFIVNKSKYNNLCKKYKVDNTTTDFFPKYRYEESKTAEL